MSPFIDVPATELRDRWVPADAVWQRSLDRIRNQVGEAVGPLHDWYFSGEIPLTEGPDGGGERFDHSGTGGGFKVSSASAQYVRPMWEAIGTIVMGRHLFGLVNGREGQPPAGDHVVVVSHRPKPEGWHPEASYHFVDGVTAAIDKAQELAGERAVAVNAGDVGGQILAAGLVDEVAMDMVRWCSGRANATSAASMGSIYWTILTWSSRATGCCI
jgi:dihydrofolate reductase